MIEDPEGLAAAADMAALPGVTGLFVGPSDLALALYGDPTLANAPKTINAARAAVDACQASGAVAGVYSGPSEHAVEAWRAAGFTMLAVDSDSNMLLTAARTQAATANRMLR
jgi:4-hydroxy-2-oxoheptanedioate aldolase